MDTDKTARALQDHSSLITETVRRQGEPMKALARQVVEIFHRGGKVMLLGSGAMGSIASLVANHFLHRLGMERPLLPVLSLVHDAVLATSLASGGEGRQYFSRQVRTVAAEGDMVLAFCSAGRDEAIEEALTMARRLECVTAAVLQGAEEMQETPDYLLRIDTDSAPRALEAALLLGHLLVEIVEEELFGI